MTPRHPLYEFDINYCDNSRTINCLFLCRIFNEKIPRQNGSRRKLKDFTIGQTLVKSRMPQSMSRLSVALEISSFN